MKASRKEHWKIYVERDERGAWSFTFHGVLTRWQKFFLRLGGFRGERIRSK